MMRRIASLILFLFLFALGLHAQTANIVFSLQNYNSQPVNVTRVSLSPIPPPAGASYGTNILNPTPYTVYSRATNPSLTNGVCTFTNVVLPYGYQLDVYDFYTNNSYQFFFPTNIASSTTNAVGFMGFFSGIYFVQLVNTNLTFSTNYVAVTSYQTNYFTLTNGLTAIVITNAVPTNTASLVANQIFYYQTNYDAGGASAAVQVNLGLTNNALLSSMSASNQQAIATAGLTATNYANSVSNVLSVALISSNAAATATASLVATNYANTVSNTLATANISTNQANLTSLTNAVNTASNSILSSVAVSNAQAVAISSLVATNLTVGLSNSILADISVSNAASGAASALVATNYANTVSNSLSTALIATNVTNLGATTNLVNTASNSILTSVSVSNAAAVATSTLVATNLTGSLSNAILADIAVSNGVAIATASLNATNLTIGLSNSVLTSMAVSNAAATATAALVATNYANTVSNSLSGAVVASNNVAIGREQAISNYAAYVNAQVGRSTNTILVVGGTSTFANANGTDVWSTASSVWTNGNGISTITPAGIITVSAINVAGSVIGYPAGGTFTNITGSGTLPTTQFLTNIPVNATITISGEVSGSGTASIVVGPTSIFTNDVNSLAQTIATAATNGLITAGATNNLNATNLYGTINDSRLSSRVVVSNGTFYAGSIKTADSANHTGVNWQFGSATSAQGGDAFLNTGQSSSGANGSSISMDSAALNVGGVLQLSGGQDSVPNDPGVITVGGGNGSTGGGGILIGAGNSDFGGIGSSISVQGGSNTVDGKIVFTGKMNGNGIEITNMLHSSTVSAGSGTTVTTSQNSDGSTNFRVASTGISAFATNASISATATNALIAVNSTNAQLATISINSTNSQLAQIAINATNAQLAQTASVAGAATNGATVSVDATIISTPTVNANGTTNYALTLTGGTAILSSNAIAWNLTNALGGERLAIYSSSNNILVASGFGSAIVNQTFFLISTNVWIAPSTAIVPTLYYVKDGSGNWDFLNTTGGVYYSSASGPTNNSYSVGALGAGPGGLTYYTNAPVSPAVSAAITAAFASANGSGITNTIVWSRPTSTNLAVIFNGTKQTFSITNVALVLTNMTGANGELVFRIHAAAPIPLTLPTVLWLSGSNTVATNAVLKLNSFGGTNDVTAEMKENQ